MRLSWIAFDAEDAPRQACTRSTTRIVRKTLPVLRETCSDTSITLLVERDWWLSRSSCHVILRRISPPTPPFFFPFSRALQPVYILTFTHPFASSYPTLFNQSILPRSLLTLHIHPCTCSHVSPSCTISIHPFQPNERSLAIVIALARRAHTQHTPLHSWSFSRADFVETWTDMAGYEMEWKSLHACTERIDGISFA